MNRFIGYFLMAGNGVYAYRGYMQEDYWMAGVSLIAFLIVSHTLFVNEGNHDRA